MKPKHWLRLQIVMWVLIAQGFIAFGALALLPAGRTCLDQVVCLELVR